MKWTIRVELTPDGNEPIIYDIGTITRRIVDLAPEQIGLTLEEGQQLLRRVQVQMISNQTHAYPLCRRPCVATGICCKCIMNNHSYSRARRLNKSACSPTMLGLRHRVPPKPIADHNQSQLRTARNHP
jgi:hypothetical protein